MHWYLLKAMASGVISSDLVFISEISHPAIHRDCRVFMDHSGDYIHNDIIRAFPNIVKYIPIFSLLKSASKAEKKATTPNMLRFK